MFGSSKSTDNAAARPADKPVGLSVIAASMSMNGDMDGEGDVTIEGKLQGTLRCRKLVVAESGTFEGTVTAQEVTVNGIVKGDITAKVVRLRATATMDGNVRHEVLEVDAGAKVEGHYSRDLQKAVVTPKTEAPKERPPRAASEPESKPKTAKGNGTSKTADANRRLNAV